MQGKKIERDLYTNRYFALRQDKNAGQERVYRYTPQGGTEVNDRLSTFFLGAPLWGKSASE